LHIAPYRKDPEERCDVAAQNPTVVESMLARLAELNATAVPVRFPVGVNGKCDPKHFNGTIQWWSE
jgi:hypothetical protein